MDSLLIQHSSLIRRLHRKNSTVTVTEIKQFLDNVVSYIKNLTYRNQKNDGFDILTIICDDLASVHTLQLFDHPALINHPIFIYMGHTLEMLLTKSNHLKSVPMKKNEEDCFYSISYLITQLCLYKNETIESFYGSISKEIFSVTDKINIRDETINETSRRSNPIAEKLNLKVARLAPSAPKSRPIEQGQHDITRIIRRKKFHIQMISSSIETIDVPPIILPLPPSTNLSSKKYQEIFLTESFLNKLARAVDDLSQNEYSPYHVKYKVIDRLVRLCSKLNIVDRLIDSIVKCLHSKFYQQTFATIESEQLRLNPKQLFFIYRCSQFIIQYDFVQQEQILISLSRTMINVTNIIIEKILLMNGEEFNCTYYHDRGIALHALGYHLELLNYFSLTSTARKQFIQSTIIEQILSILNHDVLVDNACENEELFHGDVSVIAYTLMLLYNLAYEQQVFSILKQKDIINAYSKLQSAKDISIQFGYQILSTILNQNQIDEENEPMKLKTTYLEYLEEEISKSKQTVKLSAMIHIKEHDDNVKLRVLNQEQLNSLSRDIEKLSTTEYSSNVLQYKNTGRRVRVFSKQETHDVEALLDPILKCLKSNFYLKVFENIDLNQAKAASGTMLTSRGLAAKHLFFMRECPEFLFRHDYKRRDEIADSLGHNMLEHTETIFEQHLPILTERQGKENIDEIKAARMAALSYHIKVLSHFALTKTLRNKFVSLQIIDRILSVLNNQLLIDNHERIAEAKVEFVEQSLTLLYNLGFDEEIRSIFKQKNLFDTCLKLRRLKAKTIQFTSQILMITLDENSYDDIDQPNLLSKTFIEYIDRSVKGPRQSYQGIKLDRLLHSLEKITQNDLFSEYLAEEKDGISIMTKCVCIQSPDNSMLKLTARIQTSAVYIIWKLSSFGPKISTKLKSDDSFIDQILILLNGTKKKSKKAAQAIIWRLGNEDKIRLEQTEKEKKRQTTTDTIDDEQFLPADEWDDSIPYDLLISYSNNVNDKISATKINRLLSKNYRVYSEQQGKHRLELYKKAIDQKKPILVCLSSSYRASKICMAEVEYANKHSSPIIPVLVEAKYKIQGWLKHLIGGKNPIDLTQKHLNDKLLKVVEEIENIKSSD